MKQEDFEKMRSLNETIKSCEEVLAKVDHAHVEMCLGSAAKPCEGYKDDVNATYYALIPKEERDYLDTEMRKKLKKRIQARIDELKAEFLTI